MILQRSIEFAHVSRTTVALRGRMAISLRRSVRNQKASNLIVSSCASLSTGCTTSTTTNGRKRAKIVEEQNSVNGKALSSKSRDKVPKATNNSTRKDSLRFEDYPVRAQIDWKVGAHVSAAGGVENTILNAASIGANAFALFVKSQRKWSSPGLTEQSIAAFKARLLEFQYTPDVILPHGSYLINLGNPDEEKREKSYMCFLDDLKRCEQLGLTRYNFHPGSTVGSATKSESIDHVASCLNRAHKETSTVITVIENMAGSGNVLGSKFEDIAQIINKVEDKSRVGVCLDTCHTFAAGYDIRSKESYDATLAEFDRVVGFHYLQGMHLNDSKTPLASHKDRHENIGRGHISLATFGYIMQDLRLRHIPLILETPTKEDISVWKKEIEILHELNLQQPKSEDAMEHLVKEVGRAVNHVSREASEKNDEGCRAEKRNGQKRRRIDGHDVTSSEKDA